MRRVPLAVNRSGDDGGDHGDTRRHESLGGDRSGLRVVRRPTTRWRTPHGAAVRLRPAPNDALRVGSWPRTGAVHRRSPVSRPHYTSSIHVSLGRLRLVRRARLICAVDAVPLACTDHHAAPALPARAASASITPVQRLGYRAPTRPLLDCVVRSPADPRSRPRRGCVAPGPRRHSYYCRGGTRSLARSSRRHRGSAPARSRCRNHDIRSFARSGGVRRPGWIRWLERVGPGVDHDRWRRSRDPRARCRHRGPGRGAGARNPDTVEVGALRRRGRARSHGLQLSSRTTARRRTSRDRRARRLARRAVGARRALLGARGWSGARRGTNGALDPVDRANRRGRPPVEGAEPGVMTPGRASHASRSC